MDRTRLFNAMKLNASSVALAITMEHLNRTNEVQGNYGGKKLQVVYFCLKDS